MAFCSSCGTNVGASAYCNNCGAAQGGDTGGLGAIDNNLCIRCGANLQNGVCLSCGWSAPVQQAPQQYTHPPAAAAAAPITVNVNSGQSTAGISGPPCPKCKSQSTELAAVKSKKVSGGKIAAGVMTAGISLLATGVSNKQKVDWVCRVCGNSFTVKG